MCEAILTLEDVDVNDTITVNDTLLTVAETNITFTTQQLTENHRYRVTITLFPVITTFQPVDIISKLATITSVYVRTLILLYRYS